MLNQCVQITVASVNTVLEDPTLLAMNQSVKAVTMATCSQTVHRRTSAELMELAIRAMILCAWTVTTTKNVMNVWQTPSKVLTYTDASVFQTSTTMQFTTLVALKAVLLVTQMDNVSNVNQVTSHFLPVTDHVMVTDHSMLMENVYVTAATADCTVKPHVIENVSAVLLMTSSSVQNAMETRLVTDVINVTETGIHSTIVINASLATSTTVLMTRIVSTSVPMEQSQMTFCSVDVTTGISIHQTMTLEATVPVSNATVAASPA